jgi:hypothetical protein
MNWVFYAFVGAAILHVAEEYAYPGGFSAFMKRMAPPFAPFITANFAVVMNGLFLWLCIVAALIGQRVPVFSLSIAGLCGINGLTHMLGAIRAKHYAPGLLTGVLLYLPFAVLAFYLFIRSGQLLVWQGVGSVLLGLAYQVVPISYLGLARALKRA